MTTPTIPLNTKLPPEMGLAALVYWDTALNAGAGGWAPVTGAGGAISSTASVTTGDLQIGAVEIKNDSDDTRVKVGVGDATNALRVVDADGLTVTGSVTSAAVLFTQATAGYNSISVQITSAGTSCTVVYEFSNDGTTWYAASGHLVNVAIYPYLTTNTSTVVMLLFQKAGATFRVRVSSYGSGTVAATAVFMKTPFQSCISSAAPSQQIEGTGASSVINVAPNALLARSSSKTSATTNTMTLGIATLDGRQVIRPHAIPENTISYAAAGSGIVNTTTAVTMFAAAGASIRNYLTSIQIQSEALGTATEIAVRDGAAGTVLWRSKIGTAGWLGGREIEFPVPLRGTANTLMEVVTLTASGTGAVYVNAQGYIGP